MNQFQFTANGLVQSCQPYPQALRDIISIAFSTKAREVISKWPGYGVTPLLKLDQVAAETGVQAVYYKDESSRFGLGSFKALGGAYAVYCLLRERVKSITGTMPTVEDIIAKKYADIAAEFTVACATAGNHGRSVAWGAQLFGCPCHIYLHEGVGPERANAIAHYGAAIVRVKGNYDDSVRAAAQDATVRDWTIVSDTSYPGYMEIPKYVMQGYAVMFEEIIQQLNGAKPTHAFTQGGVGGLASAAAGCLWDQFNTERPVIVVVEPDQAACLYESAKKGRTTAVAGDLNTYMLGLACGEPSLLAWELLSRGADYFMTVPDRTIFGEMRALAEGCIVAGESAVAGLAGFRKAATDPYMRKAMGLTQSSIILLFGTEGDTDPAMYNRIVHEGYNGHSEK